MTSIQWNVAIPWMMMNFGLTMLGVALIFIFFHTIISLITKKKTLADIVYRWITLFPVGLTALYAAFNHAFFPDASAAMIGWSNSPFQYEVAAANLGFGLVAIFAFWGGFGFRLASVIGVTCWLWGDAIVHLSQMISKHNFAIGNAGSWFWLDLILPLILILCIINLRNNDHSLYL